MATAKKATAKTTAPRKKVAAEPGKGLDTPIVGTVVVNNAPTPTLPVYNPPAEGKFGAMTVIAVHDKLPGKGSEAVPQDVIDAIVNADGAWVELNGAGRKLNTVRNNLKAALDKLGHSIKTKAGEGDHIYVAIK